MAVRDSLDSTSLAERVPMPEGHGRTAALASTPEPGCHSRVSAVSAYGTEIYEFESQRRADGPGYPAKTRKQYSAEEKIRIVLSGLRGDDSIAELCHREGIAEESVL